MFQRADGESFFAFWLYSREKKIISSEQSKQTFQLFASLSLDYFIEYVNEVHNITSKERI